MGSCGSESDISASDAAGRSRANTGRVKERGEKGKKEETQERTGGMLPLL